MSFRGSGPSSGPAMAFCAVVAQREVSAVVVDANLDGRSRVSFVAFIAVDSPVGQVLLQLVQP